MLVSFTSIHDHQRLIYYLKRYSCSIIQAPQRQSRTRLAWIDYSLNCTTTMIVQSNFVTRGQALDFSSRDHRKSDSNLKSLDVGLFLLTFKKINLSQNVSRRLKTTQLCLLSRELQTLVKPASKQRWANIIVKAKKMVIKWLWNRSVETQFMIKHTTVWAQNQEADRV